MDDCYRNVFGVWDVLFVNECDIKKLGFNDGDKVDIMLMWNDGKIC